MAASHSIGTAPALNGVTAFTSCTRSMPRFASVYCTLADAYKAALYVAGPVAGMNTSWMPAGTTGFATALSPFALGAWTRADGAWESAIGVWELELGVWELEVGLWELAVFSLRSSSRP